MEYPSTAKGLKFVLLMPFECNCIVPYGKPCDMKDLKILRDNSVKQELTRTEAKLHLKHIKCKKLLEQSGRNSPKSYFYPGAVLATIYI